MPIPSYPSPTKALSRQTVLVLLQTAFEVGDNHYARLVALSWLSYYPGDLEISLLHAKILLSDKNPILHEQAIRILQEICALDPEFIEAQKLLSEHGEGQVSLTARDCYVALGGSYRQAEQTSKQRIAGWSTQIREARRKTTPASIDEAKSAERIEQLIHQALAANPNTALPAIIHIKSLHASGTLSALAVRNLAQIYLDRWPKTLVFKLILADALMDTGEQDQAVEILHSIVGQDIAGKVIIQLWGSDHPYTHLWPAELIIEPFGTASPQNIPIPARVSARLGWNQLPANIPDPVTESINLHTPAFVGVLDPSQNPDEILKQKTQAQRTGKKNSTPKKRKRGNNTASRTFQAELNILAARIKQPQLAHMDGRFPIYIIFSTRQGLNQQYGLQNALLIDEEMKELAHAISGSWICRRRWGAFVFYADDPQHTSAFGIQPACHNDPWGLKLTLADLDAALAKRGEMIGALLIVGGTEVVPFHLLPNPVEDSDVEVPSDNPYATRDENYFIQEWPIGRIPGGEGKDPKLILHVLNEITQSYKSKELNLPWYQYWWKKIISLLQTSRQKPSQSLGYTAAVWQRASLSVYRSIGEARAMLVSPPVQVCDITANKIHIPHINNLNVDHEKITCLYLPQAKLGYFNLHGLPDTAEWYGQRDPTEAAEEDSIDFPVALRPQDIINHGQAPEIVFSEACYGAHILNKKVDEALSLKFLASGTHAVAGSTCISYGSISAPLIAADLLGRIFWNSLLDGYPAGEAMRLAKFHLAREMHRRQGYLDGEDQKTLISFVIYGDPLAQPFIEKKTSKTLMRSLLPPVKVNLVCERGDSDETDQPVRPELIAQVKQMVTQYLPGMADAQVTYNLEHSACLEECTKCSRAGNCTNQPGMAKSTSKVVVGRKVVTLSKNIQQNLRTHSQYARLTLDPSGKLVKLAISR